MTRSQEQYVFNAFKKLYSEFPIGQYVRGEQPDYVIDSDSIIIGVEITQIFIDNYINSSFNKKRKDSLRSLLGDSLCEKLDLIIPFKFILSIDFSTKDFSTNGIGQIVLACETYFKNVQFPRHEFSSIDIENFGQLPDEIENISLFEFSR